ncbi:triacylglycerol lipase [Streptomyces sp. RLA2-12]|uniref:esterase/lipase family protein n=1 Tax=Streptomyces sp. RLA2-12 TaxID=2721242 RepID=UPI00145C9C8C|nr:alpha/beta fold hydrolase [Streptomyces sp. RLA2-12]NMI56013.1 alpha/beta fold hydrolase [Streptomyces sp. RLA2-12]
MPLFGCRSTGVQLPGRAGPQGSRRCLLSVRLLTEAVFGATVEVAAIIAALALYPSGAGEDHHTAGSRPEAPSGGSVPFPAMSADSPVLLVHGLSSNRAIFHVMRRGLRQAGFRRVAMLNYSWLSNDVRSAARLLADEVERVCEGSEHERVHVIGHSLGGVIARYYVQRMGGDARVHTLVTLGTPHQGTLAAMVPLPHQAIRQLRPGSDVLVELAGPAPGCGTRFVAFHSDLDEMVVPTANARLVHPDLQISNVPVRAVGHVSLPLHGRVVAEVCRVLGDARAAEPLAAA